MEPQLLHFITLFTLGVAVGVFVMLLVNKIRSGSAAPKNVQQEYDQYQAEVERHFEETSKKFKQMTEQYQDLYQHLSIGATSLCRPESEAATLADQRSPMDKVVKLDSLADGKSNATPSKAAATNAASDNTASTQQTGAKRTDPKVNEKSIEKNSPAAKPSKTATQKNTATKSSADKNSGADKKDRGPKKTTL